MFKCLLRLTAPYFFALGVVQLTMKWFHYNSVFDPPTDDHLNCPKYWWRNLLYINTLFPVQDMVSKELPSKMLQRGRCSKQQ